MENNSSSSSVATCQASFLQRTLECLSSSRLKLQTEEAAPVAVTALQRYLCEQAEGQQTDSYSYDVTVTDGVCRAKCFVHPSLNHLVHTNILRTGVDIHITQGSFVYNERRLGHGYICIEQLRCAAGRSAVLPRIKDVSSLPMLVKHGMERSVLLQSDVPLQVSRKHYLSLWNNDDPEGDIWTSGCPPSDTVLDGEILCWSLCYTHIWFTLTGVFIVLYCMGWCGLCYLGFQLRGWRKKTKANGTKCLTQCLACINLISFFNQQGNKTTQYRKVNIITFSETKVLSIQQLKHRANIIVRDRPFIYYQYQWFLCQIADKINEYKNMLLWLQRPPTKYPSHNNIRIHN